MSGFWELCEHLFEKTGIPPVLGHRGYPARAEENTLASFEEALKAGADGFELDVQLTRDFALLIRHDAVIQHGGALRAVLDLDAAEVTAAPLLLEEVLKRFSDALIDIELKAPATNHPLPRSVVAEAAASAVEQAPKQERLLLTSFDAALLSLLKRFLKAEVPVGLIVSPSRDPLQAVSVAQQMGLDAVMLHIDSLSPALLNNRSGLRFGAWGIDRPEQELDRVSPYLSEASLLVTDFPDHLRSLLKG